MSYAKLNLKELQTRLDAISEDAEDYAWINVETGDHGYGTKEEMSNWTHYIPMSDFSYFSGDEDYKGLDDETAQEQGWIKVDITGAGMQQPGTASLEGLSQVSEHEIQTKDGAMYPGREEKFDQDMFNITHAISQVAKTLLPKMQAMDLQRPEYAADEDAAKYYGLELDDEPENINFDAYNNLDDSDKEKFMADYKEPPVVNPDVLDDESVKEGEAELAELKSALGRTGGVMGFTQ